MTPASTGESTCGQEGANSSMITPPPMRAKMLNVTSNMITDEQLRCHLVRLLTPPGVPRETVIPGAALEALEPSRGRLSTAAEGYKLFFLFFGCPALSQVRQPNKNQESGKSGAAEKRKGVVRLAIHPINRPALRGLGGPRSRGLMTAVHFWDYLVVAKTLLPVTAKAGISARR